MREALYQFINSQYTEMIAIFPIVLLLIGLYIAVRIDPYIRRQERRIMLVILTLVFSLVAENYLDNLLKTMFDEKTRHTHDLVKKLRIAYPTLSYDDAVSLALKHVNDYQLDYNDLDKYLSGMNIFKRAFMSTLFRGFARSRVLREKVLSSAYAQGYDLEEEERLKNHHSMRDDEYETKFI